MAKGCGCVALPFLLAGAIWALGASIKSLESSPVGRQALGWLLLLLMLAVVASALWLAWAGVLRPLGRVLVGVVVRVAQGRALRPEATGRVPQGHSPASPFPTGEAGDGGTSPGEPSGAVGDAYRGPRRAFFCDPLIPYGPVGERPPRSYLTALAAARGTGKSYLLLDLAIAALSGGAWMGLPVRRCASVLFLDFELDAQTFWERAHLLSAGRGLPGVPAGLHYLDLSGEALRVPTAEEAVRARQCRAEAFGGLGGLAELLAVCGRALGVETRLTLWGATTQERIVLRLRRTGAQLALVDSLTIGGGTAAGDQEGWRRLLQGMQRWGGMPVVVLDHIAPSGHGGMVGLWVKEGLIRSLVKLRRGRGGAVTVEHDKANFSEQLDPWTLTPGWHKDAAGRLVAVTLTREPSPTVTPGPDQTLTTEPPAPRPLPAQTPPAPSPAPPPPLPAGRPQLRVVKGEGELRGHALIDARVLEAIPQHGVDRAALAEATGYAPKTISNALSRLRARGQLPRAEAG
jgi:hypothetical protein